VLSEVNPDGRAAIRRTELLWRNEASDAVAVGGGPASREIPHLFDFTSNPTSLLRPGAFQILYAQ
jgi:hypothetical protein